MRRSSRILRIKSTAAILSKRDTLRRNYSPHSRQIIEKAAKVLEEASQTPTGLRVLMRPQIYLDATEQPRTDIDGNVEHHTFVDVTRSAHKRVVKIHPLRFAIENCGGAMTALLLRYGETDMYLDPFPSNNKAPIHTACDWISQNLAAASSLSALLEWAWRDMDIDDGKDKEEEVVRIEPSSGGLINAKNLQDVMRNGLKLRQNSNKTHLGRIGGFESKEQEATFIQAVDTACKEVEEMTKGTHREHRKLAQNSRFVVWEGCEAAAEHDEEDPGILSRAGIWKSYRARQGKLKEVPLGP